MIALLFGSALAAPLASTFPQWIPVSCPEQGLCRIEVPPPFLAANDRSWLLVDEAGELVPFAVLAEEDARPELRRASALPTEDPKAVALAPVDGYRVEEVWLTFRRGSFQARAWVETRSGPDRPWRAGPKQTVAAGLVDETPTRIRVPDPGARELRLVFDGPWTALPARANIQLALVDAAAPLPARVTVPLEASGPAEDGSTRYLFRLPGMARLRAVELSPQESTYERPARLGVWEPTSEGLGHVERASGVLRRAGDGPAERAFEGLNLAADRFTISVDDGWDRPLSIPSAEVLLARRVLLVKDAGSLALYGGDPAYAASFDLQLEATRLARLPATEATLGSMTENVEFQDPLDRAALEPGAPVEPARFRLSRSVSGAGLSRIELPAEVLTATRADLGDLRLVDAGGRQVPYVVDRGALPRELQGIAQTVEQQGRFTRLRLALSGGRVPISALALESPDSGFTRQVRVSTGDGGERRLLTDTRWEGAAEGRSSLTLGLSTEAERGLLIEIDHGDNRPIGVDRVALYGPTVALLARLPEGGATLLYGDVAEVQGRVRGPLRSLRESGWQEPLLAPEYDAFRLASALTRAPAATATLGPVVERAPQVSSVDRGAATAGIGALVIGLLGMIGWLLKDLRREGGPPAQ